MERTWKGASDLGGTGNHAEGQKRQPRLIRKGFSLVTLFSPQATSHRQPPGEQWWVGERMFLRGGGGRRDLEKEPQGQEGR